MAGPREVLSLDSSWRFHLGDIDRALPNTHLAAYMLNKAGYARGGAKPGWDDSDWRVVDLPHDWSVEGEFSPEHHVDAGFLPRGIAWYRRHFTLDESDRGRHLSITFDGVATHCTVYVNGHLLHRNFCGYTPFTIDITDVARVGEDEVNTIAVRVDATYAQGWWYEGAGIYRHVWLTKAHPLHTPDDSIFVQPQKRPERWLTEIRLTLANTSAAEIDYVLYTDLLDPQGRQLVRSDTAGRVPARGSKLTGDSLPITNPRLWSVEEPNRYTIRTQLIVGGELLEERLTPFGYRTVRFDPDHGFFLNDQPIKLKGTCNHQDHAGVGVALPDSLHEFRIRRLKEVRCNAYRCAHHPPARELLDACDRLGMLVIDENRNFGSSPQHLEQLGAMVRRDRNHPSVIAWSICNEEAIQGTPTAANIARAMTAEVRRLDPSRPVMAAVSGGILNDDGLAAAMPMVGINYQLPVNGAFHAKHPRVPIVAAETHCVLSTRGTYETDVTTLVFASDDTETAPWGATARETWRFVSSRPWLAGLFVWSGFDYRGEPTPHAWPCVSSQFGLMDLCGFPKDAFYLHKAFFTRDAAGAEPFVHLLPHWTWPGRDGESIRVRVYTNCDDAELFLNGESLGKQRVDPLEMAQWHVPYRPGELRATGVRRGEVASSVVRTAGDAFALDVAIDPSATRREVVPADGRYALPVTLRAIDEHGSFVPHADALVTLAMDGPGKILGVGNGDPASHQPNKGTTVRLFRGLAQVIVQTTTTAGRMQLLAAADGLLSAGLMIETAAVPLPLFVPPARRKFFLADWRMSPISPHRPDAGHDALAQDMNTWQRIEPGKPQPQWSVGAGYALYRTTFTPPKQMTSNAGRGRILFREISGAAEVFVNGTSVARKHEPGPAALAAPFLASPASSVTVVVIVQGAGASSGLTGAVEVQP
jgi:beta-galactosidase